MRLMMLTEARTVHAQRWARALTRRDWQVAMLSVSTTPIPGVEVIPLTTPPLGWSYPRRWWGRYAQYVRSTIRRFAPDVVHMHYLSDYPLERGVGFGRAPSLGSRRSWPPLVISTWGADVVQDQWVPQDTDRQRQSKIRLLRTADAVTATTRFLADRTAEYGGISSEGITVIPFGVDLDRYDQPRPAVPGREPVVGFVKHLEPKYGPEVLIRAMSQVVERFPTVRLVMIGAGALEQPLRGLAQALDLDGHIDWRGAIDNAEVPAALAAMDLYVMPSLSVSETFGVTAVEAQAAGVPVVFSDLPGVREAVTDGVGGLAVPPGDVGALAGAICRLLADEELRRRLGCGGRQMVRRLFEFDDQVTQMEQVYQRVTAQRLCYAR
ncbi:MAG: glycosyltransferase family 4 protein [Planctomycetes bacterium]|nr:glycosyltransferase family 4 protein [Planctomycetota bacterium]